MKFRSSRGETIGTSQNSFGVGVFTTVPREAWKSAIWTCMPRDTARTNAFGEFGIRMNMCGFLGIVGSCANARSCR